MAGQHFIQGAIKHPGALHTELHVPQGHPIPQKKLHAAAASPDVQLRRRALLAETLEKMHPKHTENYRGLDAKTMG